MGALVTAAMLAATWFISPTGNDLSPGTRAAPFASFAFAFSKLRAGDTLILLDGHYTPPTSGMIIARCGNGVAPLGTPFAPITLRADSERAAWVDSQNGGPALELEGCSYWVVDGLRVSTVDQLLPMSSIGQVVDIRDSDHITLERLQLDHSNRTGNYNLMEIVSSAAVLGEELELYDFHFSGVSFWRSHGVTLRRCYFNSRGFPDIAGFSSADPARGDVGVNVYDHCSGLRFENCIMESVRSGFSFNSGDLLRDVKVSSSIVVGAPGGYGAEVRAAQNTVPAMPQGVSFENFAARYGAVGLHTASTKWSECRRCTLRDQGTGVLADDLAPLGDGIRSARAEDSVAIGGPNGNGFRFASLIWDATNVSAHSYTTPFNPAASPNFTGTRTVDAGFGECLAYVPQSSPLYDAGIGADVLYRVVDGVTTSAPLWEPGSGLFACGARAPGFDTPDASCVDTQSRLHVGTPDCPFPQGYGSVKLERPSPPPPAPRLYFISPTGDDANPGTLQQPFGTFAYATTQLNPGDTLDVLDGRYTESIRVDCSTGHQSGRPGRTITVRADHDRAAWIDGDGTKTSLEVEHCSDWTFRGLVVTSTDDAVNLHDNVGASWSTRIVFDKLLVARNNRYGNTVLVEISSSTAVTLQDSELYDFHRQGVSLYRSHGCTVRRVYMNGRGRDDVVGGYVSYAPGGDNGIDVYDLSTDNVVENIVTEGVQNGVEISALNTVAANRVLGSVFLGGRRGIDLDNASAFEWGMPFGNTFENLVSIAPSQSGFETNGGRGNTYRWVTVIGAPNGIAAFTPTDAGSGGYSAEVIDSLLVGSGGDGLELQRLQNGAIAFTNVYGFTSVLRFPDAGFVTALTTLDAGLGACTAYLPPSSPLKGKGSDGGDIGANVLFRSVGGRLTTEPLWNPMTGMFGGCGAIAAGFNDVPDASCRDVHSRLHVGTADCPFPPGYGDGGMDAGGMGGGAGGGSGGAGGGTGGGTAGGGTSGGSAGGAGASGGGGSMESPRAYEVRCGCGSVSSAWLVGALLFLRQRRRARAVR